MIPAIAGIGDAIKGLSPLAKWGGGLVLVTMLVTASSVSGFKKGRAYERSQWQAIALAQAEQAGRDMQAQADNSNRVLAERAKREVRVQEKIVYLGREVERYVEQTDQPCVVPLDYVRRWDAHSRMLNDELLSASPGAGAGESPAVPDGSGEAAAGLPTQGGAGDDGSPAAIVP